MAMNSAPRPITEEHSRTQAYPIGPRYYTTDHNLRSQHDTLSQLKRKWADGNFNQTGQVSAPETLAKRRRIINIDNDSNGSPPTMTKATSSLTIPRETTHQYRFLANIDPALLATSNKAGHLHVLPSNYPVPDNLSYPAPSNHVPARTSNNGSATHMQSPHPHSNIGPLSGQTSLPELPSLVPNPFTTVPSFHSHPHEFHQEVCLLRQKCDTILFKVRYMILTHSRLHNHPPQQYISFRQGYFTERLKVIYDYLCKQVGPLNFYVDRIGELHDMVMESAAMCFVAIRKIYIPMNKIWPDGSVLSDQEMQRRVRCCEIQAFRLCLEMCTTLEGKWVQNVAVLKSQITSTMAQDGKAGYTSGGLRQVVG